MIRPSFIVRRSSFVISLAVLLLQGCQSYTIVQQNVFVDDAGSALFVEYGRSDRDHVSTFVSPTTGKELDFKSKLMIRATFNDNVPDCLEILNRGTVTNRIELADQSFKAWQCMNFLARGTMYETDNGRWKLLANGFSAVVYHRTKDNPPRYLEVYRGVICETADREVEKKDGRWRDITHTTSREYKKPAPLKR